MAEVRKIAREKSDENKLKAKKSLRLKHAVNGDRLKLFNNDVKHMVPDVVAAAATEQFRSWLNTKKNPAFLVETQLKEEEESRGGVRDMWLNPSLRPVFNHVFCGSDCCCADRSYCLKRFPYYQLKVVLFKIFELER
ncbi:hypothetical protein RO3G_07694 [Rhizopus delemar RA 99-880]|uniref:Uncharacterized protein n=1 Tax=Rhizopus delemar (strain RA 99-880 / ATCC MYA-4621 / FGSC 9543 / NRRL 43880) TaxID=246409 RepID=I1C3F9_RHIO9|nr:hypothetical protein RO3G_07694 [Rhizopus delemar RA 99-880]|eukprot:EIE82989.1 hypothetical protein RO3G_07694 [Rhizopus delemar RA 99-880]